eukprot:Awhi_evm1s4912
MSLVQHDRGSVVMDMSCFDHMTITDSNILTVEDCYNSAIWENRNAFSYDMTVDECSVMNCGKTIFMQELDCIFLDCPNPVTWEDNYYYTHRAIALYI